MSALIKIGFAAAVIVLTACETLPPSKGTPAILSNPSAQTTAEIADVISKALHGVKTTLAPDALTNSASVIIEKPYNEMIGRRMDRPDHFTLSLSGDTCVLTHEETSTHYALKHAQCEIIT